MTPEQMQDRKDELLEKEIRSSGGIKQWVWLSFADPYLPKGSQFLGACLVQGYGFFDALTESHRLGINPGGEVRGWELGPDDLPPTIPPNRLCSLAEIEATGPVAWPLKESPDPDPTPPPVVGQ